ncbi:DUF6894 family protein [Roseomonas chloroacetimidivorans]|uniref:DUF6894 family protein n=1 Tax=Roseomonas chloroacetimidivorans TaxID=1766656 RepID=UPI003C726AD3
MPRYFFHIQDSQSLADKEGTEIGGLKEAREEAVRLAGQMLRDGAQQFWEDGKWRLDVASPAGVVLFTIVVAAFDAPIIDPEGIDGP